MSTVVRVQSPSPKNEPQFKLPVKTFIVGVLVAGLFLLAEIFHWIPQYYVGPITFVGTMLLCFAIALNDIAHELERTIVEHDLYLRERFREDVKAPLDRLETTLSPEFLHRLRQQTENLQRQVAGLANCHYLGDAGLTLTGVITEAVAAHRVRNTFICFGLTTTDVARIYPPDLLAGVKEQIRGFVADHEREGSSAFWTDLVSPDVMSPPVNWLELFESLSHAGRQRYTLKRMREAYPIVNFIILESKTGSKEVIFGQGHHRADPGGPVFRTGDPRLVAVFEQYWEVLETDSDDIHHDLQPVAAADIEGLWFRVAYEAPQHWLANADHVPAGAQLKNAALVSISAPDHRKLQVLGHIYDPKDLAAKRSFRSTATDLNHEHLNEWRLWFCTQLDEPGKRLIAGFYGFRAEPNRRRIDRLFGEYHDDRIGSEKKLVLIGRRVTADWLSAVASEGQTTDNHRLLRAALESWVKGVGRGAVA